MTSEIAILNREAVALAADSAATIATLEGFKIFPSAQKVFALHRKIPVGIMAYGNASLAHIPWETIVGMYKANAQRTRFSSLKEYCDDFLQFLEESILPHVPSVIQKLHFLNSVNDYFRDMLKYHIIEYLKEEERAGPALMKSDIDNHINRVIDVHTKRWDEQEYIEGLDSAFGEQILKEYGNEVTKIAEQNFENYQLSREQTRRLTELAVCIAVKKRSQIEHSSSSGIVIAGFGEEELFPSLVETKMHGCLENRILMEIGGTQQISHDCFASLVPFAQREMIQTFMDGIDPQYLFILQERLPALFIEQAHEILTQTPGLQRSIADHLLSAMEQKAEELANRVLDVLDKTKREQFWEPVIRTIAWMPKQELASLAETLVNLTYVKRRVSPAAETVGGPVDVAVISKCDGFVWIRKKSYFSRESNPNLGDGSEIGK